MEKEHESGTIQPELKDVTAEQLQEARDNLLMLRESLGFSYATLPAPDRILRLLDRAIELIPGQGEPSELPYNS